MRDVQKLRELLERLEKATGPSEGIDAEIYDALRPRSIGDLRRLEGLGEGEVSFYWAGRRCYTASLDASIALVERMLPGWQMLWRTDAEKGSFANIAKPGEHEWLPGFDAFNAYASKPPLAILSALLRALISRAEGEGA